jgi:hypothetical protein
MSRKVVVQRLFGNLCERSREFDAGGPASTTIKNN